MTESTDGMTPLTALATLQSRGRMVVKAEGKQIALFLDGERVLACNNRCPHEGYPLSEGTLDPGSDCVLTCNWHNWKFSLEDGRNMTGGDRLRTYPVELRDGQVWADLADPPPQQTIEAALANLRDTFDDHEYDRMAREIGRLRKAGGDPLEALRRTVAWTCEHLEYGDSHAPAAAADWLALHDEVAWDDVSRLAAIVEAVGHFAWDARRAPRYPFPPGEAEYLPDALLDAIEAQDEAAAMPLVRGAFAAGLGYRDLQPTLARAALSHFLGFGHGAIYVHKFAALIERLGKDSAMALTLLLVRSLINGRREDLIPEFRHYGAALQRWTGDGTAKASAEDFRGASVNRALDLCVAASGDPGALYDALLAGAAWSLLHFDLSVQNATAAPVSQNISWLDFTHGLTFANAIRHLCTQTPDLWPQALLQMACFIGRNSAFVDAAQDVTPWQPADPAAFVAESLVRVFDHGQFEYIVSCHLVKTACAVHDEITSRPDAPWVPALAAALNRFLNEPLKRKHTLRTAHQSLSFVAAEG